MIIGSNNSLTYLEPCCFWLKPFKYFGRCQEREYDIQYDYCGVRLFDFRLYADRNNHIIIKNGNYEYPSVSFYEILDFLNKKGDVIVLLTIDDLYTYESAARIKAIDNKFIEICNIIEVIYKNIGFCGGYRQGDRTKLYHFVWESKNGTPVMVNPSKWSRLYRFVTKWCPFLISKLNRKYIAQYENEYGYLLLNYVNRK